MTGYGVFVHSGQTRVGYRNGDLVYDLTAAERAGLVRAGGTFQSASLNRFLALRRPQWTVIGEQVAGVPSRFAVPLDEVEPLLPFEVADYVDFYSSEHHATNLGAL